MVQVVSMAVSKSMGPPAMAVSISMAMGPPVAMGAPVAMGPPVARSCEPRRVGLYWIGTHI